MVHTFNPSTQEVEAGQTLKPVLNSPKRKNYKASFKTARAILRNLVWKQNLRVGKEKSI